MDLNLNLSKVNSNVNSEKSRSPRMSYNPEKNSDCNNELGEKLKPFTLNCLKETKLNIKHGVIEVHTDDTNNSKI